MEAELWTIHRGLMLVNDKGLMLVNDKGINAVEIETDSQCVVELIQAGPYHEGAPFRSLIRKCKYEFYAKKSKQMCKLPYTDGNRPRRTNGGAASRPHPPAYEKNAK